MCAREFYCKLDKLTQTKEDTHDFKSDFFTNIFNSALQTHRDAMDTNMRQINADMEQRFNKKIEKLIRKCDNHESTLRVLKAKVYPLNAKFGSL